MFELINKSGQNEDWVTILILLVFLTTKSLDETLISNCFFIQNKPQSNNSSFEILEN